ncbi:solute carrier family 22 member 8, partial [Plakobranchus ocellatus]
MYTFERIIDEIGGFGKFQIITEILLFSAYTLCSWSIMQMAFAGLVPHWYCVISESDSLENETFTELLAINSTWSKQNYQTCAPENGSQCSQYHFEGSYATVTEEWDLVCDRDWVRSTLISIQMAGILFGCLIAGQLSDQYGRRRVLNAFVLFHALVNFAAALAPNWQLFATARFLIGLGIGGIITTAFPYGIEFMPLKWRAFLSIFPWWGAGVLIFTGCAYVLPDWRLLHLACGFANLPCLTAWWLAPESLRWLTAKGRIDEAEAVLQKMADTNGRTLPPWTRGFLETTIFPSGNSKPKQEKSTSYLDLLKNAYLARCTAAICFM